MTENRENWLYPDASGLYFPHDGFIMRASDGKQYDYEEECELLNEYHKEYNECRDDVSRLEKENKQLNQLLDYANDLIQSHLSEYYIRQWRNFKTGHKEYNDFWEEKIKKHNELKEDGE